MYLINNSQTSSDVRNRTRGIKIKAVNPPTAKTAAPQTPPEVAEFAEVSADVVITR
ncbi:MAG: hypothetical protein SWN10_07565 [Pseudomonadota bacterium]|nr:hypothetical protein [Pseudomonadota bacterium]